MELGIRKHQFPQIGLIGKRLLFDFIYLIGHSLEVHRLRYLDAGILGIGSPDRYDSTTPRLISQVSYLKLCHHIVSTRRLVHLIIYNHTRSTCRQYSRRNPEGKQVAMQRMNMLAHGGHVGISLLQRTEATPQSQAIREIQPHLIQDNAHAVDIIAHIGRSALLLFWRNISICSRRFLQYGIAVSISQSEIYQLQHASIAGNHHVGRFQVTMHHLHVVYKLKYHEQLVGDMHPFRLGMMLLEPLFQSHSIYPFHHEAFAISIHFFDTHYLGNSGMLDMLHDIEFLLKQALIHLAIAHSGSECLQDPPSAITLGTDKDIKATSRDFCHVAELRRIRF